ncbi:hypothetical protein FNY09_19135 [Salmonella enterica]|uniref:hypothetical protein n=1 Tax=Salmonella enterica TaxID=28901 RepID=UPI0009AD384F|nr:hypothetical protein [Salmonella enterica]ECI2573633.1 hypothetical protein [Salmonella enterica subsp. enterica serovar Muenchen]EAO1055878.1 hypothetical protein [Salmonella enterica]EAW3768154.1 hypothetical protein [Salmonella enterica]EBH1200887.1 hypothetical protein [Salmonella enterica]EBI1548727.1 hypothetical protein [Salmonella enterica]
MESMAEGMIKDLVASGHALADDMTGAPSVLIRCLAAQLEVQLVRANALAAENAKLKKFCKDAAFDADYEAELGMERGGFSDALNEIKTPATDAFLAEVRAQGVERYAAQLKSEAELADEAGWDGAAKFLISESEKVLAFAAQIRQEAAK